MSDPHVVTYKWLLTTIVASSASILMIVGALANLTFYSKAAGAAIEQKVASTDGRLTEMNDLLKEMRLDVKMLIAKRGKKS